MKKTILTYLGIACSLGLVFLISPMNPWSQSQANEAVKRTVQQSTQLSMSDKQSAAQTPQEHSELKLLVSIRPLALYINRLLEGVPTSEIAVDVLIPEQSTIHDYSIRPSDIKHIRDANHVLWLGPAAEATLVKAISGYAQDDYALMQIKSLNWLSGGEEASLFDVDEGIASPLESIDHHEHHHLVDPHIWLSLKRSKTIFKLLGQYLTRFNLSKNAQQQIAKNLTAALQEQRNLVQQLHQIRQTWGEASFIGTHDAYGYLVDDWNLNLLGTLVRNPEDGVSPKQLKTLLDRARQEQLSCVLLEVQSDQSRIQRLLGEDIKYVPIDLNIATLPDGLAWSGFWQYLIEQMQSCFDGDQDFISREASLKAFNANVPPSYDINASQERIKRRLELQQRAAESDE